MTIHRKPRATASRREVRYPESDGKPMAESDIHRDEMVRLIQTLQDAFADRADIYVSGNMLLYYEEGNPRASVAPDLFLVKGVGKERRRIYKLWEEGVTPCVVAEVTSPSTRREDLTRKQALYARLGVREYYLYDPLAEYLQPALQGRRLEGGAYYPIEPDETGALESDELGLHLRLVNGLLRFSDRASDEPLLSPDERATVEAERANAEGARADAEAARANTESERANTENVRATAEAARADAEAAARREAERHIAELEALLRDRDGRS